MTMQPRISTIVLAVAVALAVTAAPSVVRADPCTDQQGLENEKTGKKNYRTIIGPDGRKVFVIEKAFVVCGKVPKPNVIYVLQASSINYEWETLKQDFLPKVVDSVRKAPF